MIEKYGVSLISVGNGTACRESEQVIVDMLKEIPEKTVQYVITNEAGAICVVLQANWLQRNSRTLM